MEIKIENGKSGGIMNIDKKLLIKIANELVKVGYIMKNERLLKKRQIRNKEV
jgi:hypothetical protein